MNRQYRRMLAKPGNGDQFAQEMYRIGIRDASTKATTNTIILACEVLREKYGFGKKRIQNVWAEIGKVAECINDNHVTVKDIRDNLADELDWPELRKVDVGCKQ